MTAAAGADERARLAARSLHPVRHLRALQAPPDIDGPRVRLGMLWAVATFVIVSAGVVAIGVWMALVSAAAAAQTSRSWPRSGRPIVPIAALTALALPLAATVGVPAMIGVAVLAAVAALAAPGLGLKGEVALTLVVGGAVGLAGSALVLARSLGYVEAVVLLSIVGAYDASAFVVGSGANNAWEGPAAGAASIAACTLAVAAVFASPFEGSSPWILGAVSAALAPLGPCAASALLGDRRHRVPALRRLDSLLLLGPAWVGLAALLLD